ncbi:MAG: hypothetical protein ABIZ72_07150 [Candidatus Limnocylindrales bacterium]
MTDAPRRSAAALSGGPRSALAILVLLGAVLGAGCGSGVVDPARSAHATPASSHATAASRTPQAAPSADPATAAVKAFVALVTKEDFSYQATFSGRDRHSTDILPISKGVLQVSGANVLVRATFAFPGGTKYPVEARIVGGKTWLRYDPSEPWKRVALKAADTMAAFAAVRTTADVTYLKSVQSDGQTFYQVSIRSAIVNPMMIPARNLSDTSLTTPKLTLLIDPAGRPVKGTAEIDAKGRVSGQLQEIVIDLAVAFSKVGQAVTIKAP